MIFTQILIGVAAFVSGIYQANSLEPNQVPLDVVDTVIQAEGPSQPNLNRIPKPNESDHIRGSLDADVVLIEYVDLECPFCKRSRPVMKTLVEDYDGRVAWVYRHFPLAFHANAQNEAEAAECVAQLGGNDAFWKYTDQIFDKTQSGGTGLAAAKLYQFAEEVGVNSEEFKTCLESHRHRSKITTQMQVAGNAGVSGTPSTVIYTKDGRKELMVGALPLSEMKKKIDPYLK